MKRMVVVKAVVTLMLLLLSYDYVLFESVLVASVTKKLKLKRVFASQL